MKIGTRVKTLLGVGTVTGKETSLTVYRISVQLDHGHTWAFKDGRDAYFMKHELVEAITETDLTTSGINYEKT